MREREQPRASRSDPPAWSAPSRRPGGAAIGSGAPLYAAHRTELEARFGHDFGSVRVHADERARASARELGARAYSIGEHIVLGDGERESDRALLAHELAHVVQHRNSAGAGASEIPRAEAEAGDASRRAEAGLAISIEGRAPPGVPMLQEAGPRPGSMRLADPTADFGRRPGSPFRSSSETFTLEGFATSSASPTADHEATIATIADQINAAPLLGGYVTILGHADRRGTESDNLQLGQRRADAVRSRLAALLQDPEARASVRAYSAGEPSEGPAGDVPALRKVTITVTRRTYVGSALPSLSLRPPDAPADGRAAPVRPLFPPPVLNPSILDPPIMIPPARPGAPALPPWFWRELPPRPPPPDVLNQLSRLLTGALGRSDIARLGADVASGLGLDRERTRRALDDAIVRGGEAGLKALLRMMIEAAAGPPSSRPPNLSGPPFPEPDRR